MPAAPRKSQPKSVPVKRGPGSDDDFEFDSSAGLIKVPSIAKAKKPNAWAMLELEAEPNQRAAQAKSYMMMLELAAGDALALIKRLDVEEMGEFMEAWAEHSGVSLGESRAS